MTEKREEWPDHCDRCRGPMRDPDGEITGNRVVAGSEIEYFCGDCTMRLLKQISSAHWFLRKMGRDS